MPGVTFYLLPAVLSAAPKKSSLWKQRKGEWPWKTWTNGQETYLTDGSKAARRAWGKEVLIGASLLWRKAERVRVVHPVEEKTQETPYCNLSETEGGLEERQGQSS